METYSYTLIHLGKTVSAKWLLATVEDSKGVTYLFPVSSDKIDQYIDQETSQLTLPIEKVMNLQGMVGHINGAWLK